MYGRYDLARQNQRLTVVCILFNIWLQGFLLELHPDGNSLNMMQGDRPCLYLVHSRYDDEFVVMDM